jgi:hypothetical protein
MKVVALPEVEQYLDSLKRVLFEEEYFGFEDAAQKYVDDLFLDIKTRLSHCPHKPAPAHFDRYGKGMYYATFRKSRHTHWYVFFRIYRLPAETVYQVRYITNSHVAARHL